jgi:hypothetical protein
MEALRPFGAQLLDPPVAIHVVIEAQLRGRNWAEGRLAGLESSSEPSETVVEDETPKISGP